MKDLIRKIEQWGDARNIIGPNAKATVKTQFLKLDEEVNEIHEAIETGNQAELVDGIGDTVVVLILMARLAKTDIETCLRAAYDEIKDRKGKMVDGTFVKEGKQYG